MKDTGKSRRGMTGIGLLVLPILLLCGCAGKFDWMVGHWGMQESDGTMVLERWEKASSRKYLGWMRVMKAEDSAPTHMEEIILHDESSRWFYDMSAIVPPQEPTRFFLEESTRTRAVFTNRFHEYPDRIEYEIVPGSNGSTMDVTVSGTIDGKPVKNRMRWTRGYGREIWTRLSEPASN